MKSGVSVIVAMAVLAVACSTERDQVVVVARIDGDDVYYREFDDFVRNNLGEGPDALSGRVLAALFEEFVDELCLRRLAVEQGFGDTAELADQGTKGSAEQLLASLPPPEVSENEIVDYFETNREQFRRPERLVLGQILLQDRKTADDTLEEILAGVEFSEAGAGRPGVVFSGYQEGMTREDLPPAYAEKVFELDAGTVSPVMVADYGFHIFHVLERLPTEELSLFQARELIVQRLARARSDEYLRTMVREAHVRYNVELLPRNLPW